MQTRRERQQQHARPGTRLQGRPFEPACSVGGATCYFVGCIRCTVLVEMHQHELAHVWHVYVDAIVGRMTAEIDSCQYPLHNPPLLCALRVLAGDTAPLWAAKVHEPRLESLVIGFCRFRDLVSSDEVESCKAY